MKEVISFSLSVALILILLAPINPAMAAKLLPEGLSRLSPNLMSQAPNDTVPANTKFQDYELCRLIRWNE